MMRHERGIFFALGVAAGATVGAATTYYYLRRTESNTELEEQLPREEPQAVTDQPLVLEWPGVPSAPHAIATFEVSLSIISAQQGYLSTVVNFINQEKLQNIADKLVQEGSLEKVFAGIYQSNRSHYSNASNYCSILIDRNQMCFGSTIELNDEMKHEFLAQIDHISIMTKEPLYSRAAVLVKNRLGCLWDEGLEQANRLEKSKNRLT